MICTYAEPLERELKSISFSRILNEMEMTCLRAGLRPVVQADNWCALYRDLDDGTSALDVYRYPGGVHYFRVKIRSNGSTTTAGPVLYRPAGHLPPPVAPLVNKLLNLVIFKNE